MALASSPFYWLTCDGPDCKNRCPGGPGDDYASFASGDQAREYALGSDWKVDHGGKDYCWDCSLKVCDDCGAWHDIEYPGEQDYLCIPCWERSEG
jgi:hypothetical protein